MAKTTIDGLKVRESSDRRPVQPMRSSAHSIDMMKRRSGNTPNQSRRQRSEMVESIDAIRNRSQDASSFLDPIETFNFDAEPTEDFDEFSAEATADWSDLLGDMEQSRTEQQEQRQVPAEKKSTKTANDFLENWDEAESDDFLTKNSFNEEDDEPEEPQKHQKPPRRHKKHHFGRNFAIATLCLLLIGGGVFYKWGDELISRLTGGNSGLWDAIHSMISDEVPFETDSNGRTNVLVFGTEGYNMNGDTAYGEHGGSQLTDSIMVISLDQETKDVALLSLPRDLKVPMACSAGKINEVFYCHNQDGTNEEAGAKALMSQVGDILGMKFQYYAHVNWASLIDIIDTLGGITVTLDEDINDYGWTNAVAQAGVPIEVNGEQALGLARARHGTVGGDFTRGNTQQKIVAGIVDKVMKNGVGINEALGLLNILGDNLRSNFSTDNVKAGIRLAAGFDINNIRNIPLVDYETNTFYVTTTLINDISYVVPSAGNSNYNQIKKYVAEMLENNPVAREKARISVYNGSGQYGIAGAERDRLQTDGYEVVSVGDTEVGSCAGQYCVYAIAQEGQDFTATKAALAQRYGVEVMGAEELPGDIEPGEVDFVIVLGYASNTI